MDSDIDSKTQTTNNAESNQSDMHMQLDLVKTEEKTKNEDHEMINYRPDTFRYTSQQVSILDSEVPSVFTLPTLQPKKCNTSFINGFDFERDDSPYSNCHSERYVVNLDDIHPNPDTEGNWSKTDNDMELNPYINDIHNEKLEFKIDHPLGKTMPEITDEHIEVTENNNIEVNMMKISQIVRSFFKKFNQELSCQQRALTRRNMYPVSKNRKKRHRKKLSCKTCHRKLLHTNPVCSVCSPRCLVPEVDGSVIFQQKNEIKIAKELTSSFNSISSSVSSVISLRSNLNELIRNGLKVAIILGKPNKDQLEKEILHKEEELSIGLIAMNRKLRFVQHLRSWRYFRPDPLQLELVVFPGLHDYFQRVEQGPISREESMNYEWIRLSSLSTYTGAGSAIQLARHGFYHNPEHGPLATRCYVCQLLYTNWDYFDNIEDKHRRLSPNCPLVRNNEPTPQSVSIVSGSDKVTPQATVEVPQVTTTPQTTASVTNITNTLDRTNIRDMAPEGFPTRPTEDRLNSEYNRSSPSTSVQGAVFGQSRAGSPGRSDLGPDTNTTATGASTNENAAASNTPQDPLTTPAASVLLEMGYSMMRVEEAILAVRRNTGNNSVNAEQAMVWILDQEERAESTAPASTQQTNVVQTTTTTASAQGSTTTSTTASNSTTVQSSASTSVTSAASSTSLSTTSSQSSTAFGESTTSSTPPFASVTSSQVPSTKGQGRGSSQDATGGSRSVSPKAKSGTTTSRSETPSGNGENRGGEGKRADNSGGKDSEKKDTQSVKEENEKMRQRLTCKICLDKLINVAILPCGHLVCCEVCASYLGKCPICRKKIEGSVKILMS